MTAPVRTQAEQAARLRRRLVDAFGTGGDIRVFFAPGRVNLIGEHTDYNDGYVLPMTLDRGVYIAARRRDDTRARVASLRFSEQLTRDLDTPVEDQSGGWARYVFGVIAELRKRQCLTTGFDLVIDGDLDIGGGLSSSAALDVATTIALLALSGQSLTPAEIARLCQQVEHRYAGVHCGIMDPFASAAGQAGHALLLDCRSLATDHIPLALDEHKLVIINTGVKRSLIGSAYNVRRRECEDALAHFQQRDPSIRALRDVGPGLLDASSSELSAIPLRRARHIITENERVVAAVQALRAGQLVQFGDLMWASHDSLRDDFDVSCAELDELVAIAARTEGVIGSRMTGGGFGGCTVSLVERDALDGFLQRVRDEYRTPTGDPVSLQLIADNRAATELQDT
ncbi:MAG: galactokinase [Pseudomonadota bacterium]